jgi:hypothetical protein
MYAHTFPASRRFGNCQPAQYKKFEKLPRALRIINICALERGMRGQRGPWRSMWRSIAREKFRMIVWHSFGIPPFQRRTLGGDGEAPLGFQMSRPWDLTHILGLSLDISGSVTIRFSIFGKN